MDGISEDVEMNTISQVPIREDGNELEQDAIPPMEFGPMRRRRQDWEFKRRHIEFMALGFCLLEFHDLSQGGTMGIGIFLKSAQSLFLGGPVAMILAYLWVGSVAYAVTVDPRTPKD